MALAALAAIGSTALILSRPTPFTAPHPSAPTPISAPRHPPAVAADPLAWLNPGYWRLEYIKAAHITNNVPPGSDVLELGGDAKNLYYVSAPKAMTLVSEAKLEEAPIREAAAKLSVPLSILSGPLQTLPLRMGSFDAVVAMKQLQGTTPGRRAELCDVLARALKPGGRLVFIEPSASGMPALLEQASLTVMHDEENDHDIGVAVKPRDAPKEAGVLGKGSRAVRRKAQKRNKKGGKR